ncbi:MAG TPA: hypothetical protein PK308_00095 [Phycisphaerales bacterium]|nr:hypothetical protein [Phycisphaerales bacterium]
MSLLSLEDLQEFLGPETDADTSLLESTIARVEGRFLRDANRTERPFQAAQPGRVEVKDGTGSALLFTDYPVGALSTVITLGYASPWDESLTPSDVTVIQFAVGSRRVARVDGGTFGALDRPGYVRITYDAQADQPEDLKLILMRAVAAVYRESNTGEASSERRLVGTDELPLPADLAQDWADAVREYWEPRL